MNIKYNDVHSVLGNFLFVLFNLKIIGKVRSITYRKVSNRSTLLKDFELNFEEVK